MADPQKKPRPEAGVRIRHLGEDGLTGESIIRLQELRLDIGAGSLGPGKNHSDNQLRGRKPGAPGSSTRPRTGVIEKISALTLPSERVALA